MIGTEAHTRNSPTGSFGLLAAAVTLALVACSSETAPGSDRDRITDGAAGTQRRERFYIANTESESLSVIDHESRAVVATIPLGNKPHGQAPSSVGDRLYATMDSGNGEVVAIDTSDQSIAWRLPVGKQLNEPHLTHDDRLLYAPDLLDAKVWVVDVEERAIVAEVAMVDEGGNPLFALHNTYSSHDGRYMYVTAILSQTIARIDVATNQISRRYLLDGDPRPAAITRDDRTMYLQLSDLHGFIELDLETGVESRRIEWPEPTVVPPGWVGFTGLPTKCHGIGITPDGTELWAATSMEGLVYVYGLPGLEELARIDVGDWPNWVAFSADGATAYVSNSHVAAENGTVSVVDVKTRAVEATLDVGAIPKRIHRVDLPLTTSR